MLMRQKNLFSALWGAALFLGMNVAANASEAELHIPELNTVFNIFGSSVSGTTILTLGMFVAAAGMIFGLVEFLKIKNLPAHESMLEISALIYETCKTYLFQQGKLLVVLEAFIGSCIFYYFYCPRNFGIRWSCLVRNQNQHLRQLPHRFCFAQKETLLSNGHPTSFGNVDRRSFDLR